MTANLRSSLRRAPPGEKTTLGLGNLGLALKDGHVGGLGWHGVELLRGVSYPIRDADWGTVLLDAADDSLAADRNTAQYIREFATSAEGFAGRFTIDASASGEVSMDLVLVAQREHSICRAGFTLLHPIVGLAGDQLTVVHSDGTAEMTHFPAMISPSQPAREISGLRYRIDGCAIEIAMSGDVFEMEDQRNWSDASYKTYCRPLARPYPYVVRRGETITQRIEISLLGQSRPARKGRRSLALQPSSEPLKEAVPAVALAVEREWKHCLGDDLADVRRIIRVDLRSDDLSVLEDASAPFDLEVITDDEIGAAREGLRSLAGALARSNWVPGHVLAAPSAYLKSHQPDGPWPVGAAPEEVADAARAAFPNSRIGGGVLTNFAEFNRCRPDPARVDYVSHGSSAIVHAADDESVFQTIEALPHIFASTRAIAPALPYRLGLVSIGMRTNPYGPGLNDNRERTLRTMTAADPRASTIVGAAWMVAAMAATKGFGIEVIALGSPAGPFGIVETETGRLRPGFHVVRGLHSLGGLPRASVDSGDPALHVVAAFAGDVVRLIVANGGANEKRCRIPAGARGAILDQTTERSAATDSAWTENAARELAGELQLAPYAVAFLSFARREERRT